MSNRMWTEEGNLGMCGGLGLRLALGPRLGAWGWALAGRGGRGGGGNATPPSTTVVSIGAVAALTFCITTASRAAAIIRARAACAMTVRAAAGGAFRTCSQHRCTDCTRNHHRCSRHRCIYQCHCKCRSCRHRSGALAVGATACGAVAQGARSGLCVDENGEGAEEAHGLEHGGW